MKISIAMATYNGAAHIAAQLQSFASQTRRPHELIVCDDGSTDATLEIVDEFARDVPFDVVVERNATRLGFTGNFSKAMGHATGDVIFLSDQDDVWDSTKIDRVLQAFAANPEQWLVVHDGRLIDPAIDWCGVTMLGQVMAGYGTSRSLITGALTAFRRELQACALPVPDGMVGHDQWLHHIADLLGKRLVIPDVLQTIQRHGGNTSAWVASSTQQISKWAVFRAQLQTKAADSYADRLLINEAAQACLRGMNASFSSGMAGSPRLRTSLAALKHEQAALCDRDAMVSMSRPARMLAATRMLVTAKYRHFNGIKSFIRDVIR